MYTFKLVVSCCKGVEVPQEIVAQFEEKVYPKIAKKLQKAGYGPGNYWISLSRRMWELNADDFRAVHPNALFNNRRIHISGVIDREYYPDAGPNSGKCLLLITGDVNIYWDVSNECSEEEIRELIVDGDLTQLLLSPVCQIGMLDPNMQPLLYNQDTPSQASRNTEDEPLKFSYEIIGEDYPDTIFHIHFSRKVTKKHLEQLAAVLNGFVREQLEAGDDEEVDFISYIGEVTPVEEDAYAAEVHIDFGGCEPETILDVLKELSEKVKHIVKVIVN